MSRAADKAALPLAVKVTPSLTSLLRQAAIRASASCRLVANGHSMSTCLPAWAAPMPSLVREQGGASMYTASTSGLASTSDASVLADTP